MESTLKKDRQNKNKEVFDLISRLGSTFASSARIKILQILGHAPRSVETLSEMTGESVANTSQHLQRLLRDGLVSCKKEGLSRVYRLSDVRISQFLEHLFDFAEYLLPKDLVHEARELYSPISFHDLMVEIENKRAILLDIREKNEVDYSPVENSLHVPFEELEIKAKSKEFLKNKTYYLFCRGRFCHFATEGVSLMRSLGYKAYALKDSPIRLKKD